jgi:predicted metal-dependent phosphoesterase TrpH
MGIEETILQIKQQGGVVCIPHPFDKFRKSRITPLVIDRIVRQIDILEVYNSRNLLSSSNRMAKGYAIKHKKLSCVGSDAHLKYEIGKAYVEVDNFDNPKQFLQNLACAKLVTHRSGFWVHLVTKFIKLAKPGWGQS